VDRVNETRAVVAVEGADERVEVGRAVAGDVDRKTDPRRSCGRDAGVVERKLRDVAEQPDPTGTELLSVAPFAMRVQTPPYTAPPVSPFAVSVVPSKHKSWLVPLLAAAGPLLPSRTAAEKTARMPSERVSDLASSTGSLHS